MADFNSERVTIQPVPALDLTQIESDITYIQENYAQLSGASFTGEVDVVSATTAGSTSVRQITMSTSTPSGGADGDVWLVYT